MIIKKEEYKQLCDAKVALENGYKEIIKSKNEEIQKLKTENERLEALKPDEIKIHIYQHPNRRVFFASDYCFEIEDTNLNLSQGVKYQIYRIFRKSLDHIQQLYEKEIKWKEDIICEMRNDKINLFKLLSKLPYFTTRRKVINTYDQITN